jgi:glutamate racemase
LLSTTVENHGSTRCRITGVLCRALIPAATECEDDDSERVKQETVHGPLHAPPALSAISANPRTQGHSIFLAGLNLSRILDCMPIGICDWGIGGLGFYGLLRAERPDLDVVYIGDQGVPGYGFFDRLALTHRIEAVFRKFLELGVSEVVVACNAASTVIDDARVDGVRGIGIIQPTLDTLYKRKIKEIGIIGGQRTVRSGVYSRALRAQGIEVRQRVAQPLSRRIEDGEATTPGTLRLLSRILSPLRTVDHLVLACTHYVVLDAEIRERLPNVIIVDPAAEAWRQFRKSLPPKTGRTGETVFLTTGDPRAMEIQARAAFHVEATVEGITL